MQELYVQGNLNETRRVTEWYFNSDLLKSLKYRNFLHIKHRILNVIGTQLEHLYIFYFCIKTYISCVATYIELGITAHTKM